jgi:cell division protein FtsQ
MSPDRTTITRAEAIRRRKEEEEKRREKSAPKIISRLKPTLKPEPKPAAKPKPSTPKPTAKPRLISAHKPAAKPKAERVTTRNPSTSLRAGLSAVSASRLRHRYDIAMTSPYGRAGSYERPKAPAISMPKISIGPRLLSFLLTVLCAAGLYTMFSMDPFIVRNASILGNNRVGVEQIANVLGVANQPAALLNPAEIEYNILAAFPDIASASVEVDLPARVVVTVSERQPVVVWQQDGQTTWVDAQGYAFAPRGDVQGLVTVTSTGAPPIPANLNLSQTIGARAFLTSDLSAAIVTLSPLVPEGATLVFDPAYGLGWSDPRGWRVYFGHSDGDAAIKYQVYQSMVDYLTKHNIQPTLISVEYPDAPFYRIEQ